MSWRLSAHYEENCGECERDVTKVHVVLSRYPAKFDKFANVPLARFPVTDSNAHRSEAR